ncbi:MAG TPA: hypothetical protein VJC18_04865, partial [bacterium]|nr:hypothetical protein [bacterium]
LSTLDSYLFIAGTTISYDLMPFRFRNRRLTHNLGMIFAGVVSILLGVFFEGNIKNVWKTFGSYFSACFLVPIVLSYVFPKRIGDRAFVAITIITAIVVTAWRLWERQGFWQEVDELYIGMLVSALLCGGAMALSATTN